MQDPLGAGQGLLQRVQGVEADRVDQERAGALAAELDQVGARGVAVAGGALGVDRDRPGAAGQRPAGLGQRRRGVGERRQAVAQLEQGRRRCLRLLRRAGRRRRRLGVRRRGTVLGSVVRVRCHESSVTGAAPATAARAWRSRPRGPAAGPPPYTVVRPMPRRAPRCRGARRPAAGVHEARISICALPESSAIAPKLSVATRVTVPEAAAYVAPCAVERLGQPRPADVGQRRVGDHLEVDLGAGVGDAAERAVPRVVARRGRGAG